MCMYIYINTLSYSTFSMGQQCQYLAHGTWPCQRKKENKKYIGRDIYLFSLKLAFDMMIFYCRLGEGRDKLLL